MNKSFLLEYNTFDNANMVLERIDENGKPQLYMKGIFMQGGIQNQNKRKYKVQEIARQIELLQNDISGNKRTLLGECDHPQNLTINLDRVSHIITHLWMDGQNGMGKLKIIPTPMGNIIKTLLEAGSKLGVSTRGSGNVGSDGLVEDFELITVDIVAQPSAPDAYPTVIKEALYSPRGHIIRDLSESVNFDVKAQRYLKDEVIKWINGLK